MIGEELAIRWPDGSESFHPLAAVRRSCPCALCQGEKGLTGPFSLPAPAPESPASFRLVSFEMTGGYGIRFVWGDGHSSGIYPFPLLRGGTPANPASA